MLFATGLDVIGHGPTAIGALGRARRGAASERLLRRVTGVAFLLALVGIGLAFPMV